MILIPLPYLLKIPASVYSVEVRKPYLTTLNPIRGQKGDLFSQSVIIYFLVRIMKQGNGPAHVRVAL